MPAKPLALVSCAVLQLFGVCVIDVLVNQTEAKENVIKYRIIIPKNMNRTF